MSVFFRRGNAEARSITTLPWSHGGDSPLSDDISSQLSLVPVYASARLLSEAIASLTLQRYRKTADGGRVPMPLPTFLSDPLGETQFTWLQKCVISLLLPGNAYGLEVGSDAESALTPQTIEWLNPNLVAYMNGRWTYNGAPLDERRLLHIPGLSIPGQRLGLSPLGACAATLRTGKASQDFMKDWNQNRALPGVHYKNQARTLTPEEADAAKQRIKASVRNGDPFITGNDWDLNVIKLSAEDAGFVASMRLTATQIANIYGVPPEMVGGETGASMTYANTEQQQIQFLNMTLRPWLVRLEQAFSALLPKPQYVKFNVDSMIRVDTKTRYEVHQIARNIGLNNIDELRALEDRQPLPNGAGQDYTPLAAKTVPAQEQARAEARAADEREAPIEVHSHTHLHQDGATIPVTVERSETVIPAPVVNIQNDVHVPEQEPPVVNVDARTEVNVPEGPAPTVVNEVNPTPITVENNNNVQPADVTVVQAKPSRRKIVRDRKGEITEVIEE